MQEKPFSGYAFALLYLVRTGLYFLVFLAGYIVLRRMPAKRTNKDISAVHLSR